MSMRHVLALAIVNALAASVPLSAHHAWPVDRAKEVTVKGTVTAFNWSNPHVMIDLDVKADSGKVEKWSVGGPSPDRMARNGWDRNTLKPGDVVTGFGYRYTDGSNVVQLQRIVTDSGKEMLLYGRR